MFSQTLQLPARLSQRKLKYLKYEEGDLGLGCIGKQQLISFDVRVGSAQFCSCFMVA